MDTTGLLAAALETTGAARRAVQDLGYGRHVHARQQKGAPLGQ